MSAVLLRPSSAEIWYVISAETIDFQNCFRQFKKYMRFDVKLFCFRWQEVTRIRANLPYYNV